MGLGQATQMGTIIPKIQIIEATKLSQQAKTNLVRLLLKDSRAEPNL